MDQTEKGTVMTEKSSVWNAVSALRKAQPLVLNITNFVVMNNTANALLALGASPLMAHAPEELDEMLTISQALVLNIGTLSAPWIESMKKAGEIASTKKVPVVLDPVGAGASRLRTQTSLDLIECASPAVIRGNGSEIMALAAALGIEAPQGADTQTKGVDSQLAALEVKELARGLARKAQAVVCVSGPEDYVTDGDRGVRVIGGSSLMPRVTGLGCTATSLVGAMLAVVDSPFDAAVHAMHVMSTAGAMAASRAAGPGTLQLHFYDALYSLDEDDLLGCVQVEED